MNGLRVEWLGILVTEDEVLAEVLKDFELREAAFESALVGCGPLEKLGGSTRFLTGGRDKKSEGSAVRFRELCGDDKSFSELAILPLSDASRLSSLLCDDRVAAVLGGEGDHPEMTSESGPSSSMFCGLLADQSRLTVPKPDRTCEDAPDLCLQS